MARKLTRPKHCKKCGRVLRAFNKSGYCTNCYSSLSKREQQQVKKKMEDYRENLRKIRESRKLYKKDYYDK